MFKILEKIPVIGSTTAKAVNVASDIGTARAATQIPNKLIPYSQARIAASNKLAELAPYGAVLGAGMAAEK